MKGGAASFLDRHHPVRQLLHKSPTMKILALLLSFLGLFLALPLLAAETVKIGQFEAQLAEDNAWLPSSIRWVNGGVELLRPETGLNLSFTSFEKRNKFYREENQNIWKGKNEPRFVTDVKVLGKEPCSEDGFSGVQVNLESSYARAQRRLMFHTSESCLKITYSLEFTRDVILHETEMLGLGIQFHEDFDQISIPDGRAAGAAPLTATGRKNLSHSVALLHAGPRLLVNPSRKVSLLVLDSHTGEGLEQPPVNLLFLKKGRKLEFRVEMLLGPQDDPTVAEAFTQASAKIPAADKPFLLVADARILAQQGNFKDAEDALLEAGRLKADYAAPYGALAGMRRDHKLPGETEAWLEGGYRMPYNYGYMLSGGGYSNPALTEEQRRQHIFNVLIAVENAVFYTDYYLWATRGFLKMDIPVQVCAMYRQALWAADFMPRREEVRQKLREECQKKISELEGVLKNHIYTNLPPATVSGLNNPSLTEEPRRQHLFNVLFAAKNAAFSQDEYLWAADEFLKMNMQVQACAMYRQALWESDFIPAGEDTRQKLRENCRKKISDLEEALKSQTCTNLPPLIPIRLPAK